MPAKPLTEQQLEEARTLKRLFNEWKRDRGATQADALDVLDFTQSALSQYLNGRIPLNPTAAAKFSRLLRCEMSTFAPSVAAEIYGKPSEVAARVVEQSGLPGEAATPGNKAIDNGEDPVQPSPTLGATILQLGALLATLSPMGLKTVSVAIEEVLKDPSKAREAAETADAIARTQRMPVSNETLARSFGRAQESPVETGLSPLYPQK